MSLSSLVSGNSLKTTIPHLARFIDVNKDIPKFQMPEQSMSESAAYSIIRNELRLDGNPDLNLASFVTTEVDKECHSLMIANLNKNLVDTSQYGHTSEIQDRCVNILANLFHAPANDTQHKGGAVGTATVGSSEAIMLAGLALKWRWRIKQAAKQGTKPDAITTRCNLIFSAAVHVSVLKLCRYFDIEARIIPIADDRYTLDIDQVIARCDDNTCGVLAILGTTLTGEFDDIKELNIALLKLKAEKGLDISIHVDGASGAMVAPFVFPTVEWDFRLDQVRSINTSGHKYGLVLPGLGWIIWRRKEDLPDDLVFRVNYLGVDEETFNLNFSRSAAHVIGQYYQFIRLGVEGYKVIMKTSMENANYLAESLLAMCEGLFIIRSQHNKPSLPMVAFSLNPTKNVNFNETDLVHSLRERGWIIPAYKLAANASDITVCRIVVRETFTRNTAAILIEDIRLVLIHLADHHGNHETVESLKAGRDDAHQHRRSKRHAGKVAQNIQSNEEARRDNGNGNAKIIKKNKQHIVHGIC